MRSVRFLHIADVHFDSKMLELDERKRSIRRIETQMTFKKVLNDFSDAEIVLIAGDLFDGEYNHSTITFLCKLFEEYAEKQFLIACGNHDYIGTKSIQVLREDAPSNVCIFGDSMAYVDFDEFGLRVYGCSFSAPHLYSSILSGFRVDDDSLVNIMLVHGDVDSASKYNPIDTGDISLSGLDYLALGHKHTFSGINYFGNTAYAYPGILEPRGFDECGACGVIYGTIENKKISAKFVPVSARNYEIFNVDLSGLSSDAEVIEKINALVCKDNLYRIILTGEKSSGFSPDISAYGSLVDAFYCEFADETYFNRNITEYANENSLRGRVADTLNNFESEGAFADDSTKKDVIDILTELLCGDGRK